MLTSGFSWSKALSLVCHYVSLLTRRNGGTKSRERRLKEFESASGGRQDELDDLEVGKMRVFRYLQLIHACSTRACGSFFLLANSWAGLTLMPLGRVN